ncbi:UPF0488 protein CG14286-like isoform X2 [Uranotaenia lowii]|uniref:UPF0488 protein CG14286-like isoform X2 n=1 Tax=Uranotaenia lowii TaxID=190385 RepID=UPI00247A448F|nr:UPF0488 protein CG14286-like isoform X2 [Uranotaenia lowii]
MAPPKARLHKGTGKLKSIPTSSSLSSHSRPSSSTAALSSTSSSNGQSSGTELTESNIQFELELYWCVQQLENSLNAPHIRENNKKVEDTLKLINTLKSPNQPLIKKRQIMRSSFGDYRKKMADEEAKMALRADSLGFDAPKKKAKYHFVKKAAILTEDKTFRFNFSNIQLEDNESKTDDAGSEKREGPKSTITKIDPCYQSDNSFRFNFTLPE